MNKFTSLKKSFLSVFEQLDSTEGLLAWTRKSPRNQEQFYSWLAKMLPREIGVDITREQPEVDLSKLTDAQLETIAKIQKSLKAK